MDSPVAQHWSFTQTLPDGVDGALEITNEAQWKAVVGDAKGKKRVVVLFTAKWCPPSRFFRRHYDEAAESSSTRLCWVDVEREEMVGVCRRSKVDCTPALVCLRGGAERGRLEGVSPKFSAEHPYTGPLLSSRTIEFAASARGASKGTSGRRKPLITLENFDAFAGEDAFATTRSTVSDLFG